MAHVNTIWQNALDSFCERYKNDLISAEAFRLGLTKLGLCHEEIVDIQDALLLDMQENDR